jgi:hypothetical protein
VRSAALAGVLVALGVWVIMALAGCGATPETDRGFWRPWYEPGAGSGGADDGISDGTPSDPVTGPGMAGAAAPGTDQTTDQTTDQVTPNPDSPPTTPTTDGSCALAVSVTTASFGGTYAPSNIGAIWIADDRDRFIKTLAVWADRRREHLDRWVAATTAAGLPNNRLDAVSTATKTSHGARSARWDCTDAGRALVADGNYRVCFELTESNGAGPLDCVAFIKGPAALDLAPDDRPTFKKRRVVFTP